MTSILDRLQLTEAQAEAATTAEPAVVVTAGAGSGKTRTLAARYVGLLEAGCSPQRLVAITFTDKAAREMRGRIRRLVADWLLHCPAADRPRWQELLAGLEGARIGTIHSFCAALLRTHPAEAGVDPAFTVLDENEAALLKARVLETAMAWAANDAEASALFGSWKESRLREMLRILLDQRLEAAAAFDTLGSEPLVVWRAILGHHLDTLLSAPAWQAPLADLAGLQARRDSDRLEQARREVLALWRQFQAARQAGRWDAALNSMAALRGAIISGGAKTHWDPQALAEARRAMADLRAYFDDFLAPLADSKKPIRWDLDQQVAERLPLLRALFDLALAEYHRAKEERYALDFDDLEAMATHLLTENAPVRARWQAEVDAVLVDEFQDTNHRQRQIVYALSAFGPRPGEGEAASLFVVGDAKQSIYRFRGADVTVFRDVQADIAAAGGQCIDLDLTFRAHQPLVQVLNDLLAPILGHESDPQRPYQVPFAPLKAYRDSPRPGIRPPFIEFCLGLGANAEEGRQAAGGALANRLRKLHDLEEVDWGDVALLFRASTGFPPYEDALEAAGIPFVTVAGRGFYERPEVRDLLNALAALADPTDDVALAGLLRSPAVGLPDAALYRLRFGADGRRRNLWVALQEAPAHWAAPDAGRAAFACNLIEDLTGLAGRAPVAELLKQFMDATHYRPALALAGGERLLRNVDKLLDDAHHSGLVSVAEFLDYIRTLRDVGAREGEAAAEAGGAVQLMTVHKAKGLEFPVVVIADAARGTPSFVPPLVVESDWGVLPDLRDDEASPALYRLAIWRQAEMEEAESRRLLYVAATRAREKLLVSGYTKLSTAKRDPGRLQLRGWLAWLGEVVGLDEVRLEAMPAAPQHLDLAWGGASLACTCHPLGALAPLPEPEPQPRAEPPDPARPLELLPGLAPAPLEGGIDDKARDRESDPPPRVWRVVPRARRPISPAWVVGSLVHAALRRWIFPDQPGFVRFLQPHALDAGLTDPVEINSALQTTRRLLARFCDHPLWAEIDAAERYHELPYVLEGERGILDLLYRRDDRWTVAEFKTDRLPDLAAVQRQIEAEEYDRQVRRYARAVERLLGARPRALFIFMNVAGEIQVIEQPVPE
ncbi:MAG: UvrD-helicase domain-containing protein [Anaerolineae bacterium]